MSRFINEELKKISLSDDEYVEVLSEMSVDELEKIQAAEEKTDIQKSIVLLAAVVKNWNFLDKDGKPVPCTEENVRKLNIDTIASILQEINNIYNLDKKK